MKNSKKTVYICCNGCDRRELDADRLTRYFQLNDYKVLASPAHSDYIIFVTCADPAERAQESYDYLKTFSRFEGEIIVAGCLPDIVGDELRKNFKGKIVTTRDLNSIDQYFQDIHVPFAHIPDGHRFESTLNARLSPIGLLKTVKGMLNIKDLMCHGVNFFTTYAMMKKYAISPRSNVGQDMGFLRISRGCSEKCSYCGVRCAIGPFKSKPLQTCCEEYKNLFEKGYQKIVLTADNLGAYGLDVGITLADLLDRLALECGTDTMTWRLREIRPNWLLHYGEKLKKHVESKKISAINCPIQSGSDRVLGLMNREYKIDELARLLKDFKSLNPGLFLGTHIIIGFPSETQEEFTATLDAVKRLGFNFVALFPYYVVKGTPAAELPEKHSQMEIRARERQAIRFFAKARIAYLNYGLSVLGKAKLLWADSRRRV